jgi:uncharacterized protein
VAHDDHLALQKGWEGARHDIMTAPAGLGVGTVVACWRHPTKSLQGLVADALEIDPTGVDGDRTHGIIDVETGRLLTAKRTSVLLQASADDEGITLPDGGRFRYDDPAIDQALSAWLDRKVRLVTSVDAGPVTYEMTFDPPNDQADAFDIPVPEGTLLDITPVHVLSATTLAACADARPDLDWDVRRFRPNLVLDLAIDPWEEQGWFGRPLAIGSAVLRITGPMVRCAMPLRAQPGGIERQPELFRALSELNVDYPNHLGLCCEVEEAGRVEQGDEVTLLS